MHRDVSVCDFCGKEGRYNYNYGCPSDWYKLMITKNESNLLSNTKDGKEFCSMECLIQFINRNLNIR